MSGRGPHRAPLKGATSATVRVDPEVAPELDPLDGLEELLLPQAASMRARAAAPATAPRGRIRGVVRGVCLCSPGAWATVTGVVDFMDSP